MAVLSESPWYQQILLEGEARGEKRGEERGRREERLSSIEMGLELKFGTEGLKLMPEISQITDLERLKAIWEGINPLLSLWENKNTIPLLNNRQNQA